MRESAPRNLYNALLNFLSRSGLCFNLCFHPSREHRVNPFAAEHAIYIHTRNVDTSSLYAKQELIAKNNDRGAAWPTKNYPKSVLW